MRVHLGSCTEGVAVIGDTSDVAAVLDVDSSGVHLRDSSVGRVVEQVLLSAYFQVLLHNAITLFVEFRYTFCESTPIF